jgi:hypothetical protein
MYNAIFPANSIVSKRKSLRQATSMTCFFLEIGFIFGGSVVRGSLHEGGVVQAAKGVVYSKTSDLHFFLLGVVIFFLVQQINWEELEMRKTTIFLNELETRNAKRKDC